MGMKQEYSISQRTIHNYVECGIEGSKTRGFIESKVTTAKPTGNVLNARERLLYQRAFLQGKIVGARLSEIFLRPRQIVEDAREELSALPVLNTPETEEEKWDEA